MRSVSLKIQITFLVILLIAGLVSSLSVTVARIQKKVLAAEIRQKVVLQGRNLALSYSKPLLHTDPEFELHPQISRIVTENSEVVSIVVVDNDGIIKGHHDLTMIDRAFKDPDYLSEQVEDGLLREGEKICRNDDVILASVPVTDQGETIGRVYLEYSMIRMREALSTIYSRIVRIGLVALGLGAVLSLLLALHITRPVSRLTRGAESIGEGRLDTRIEVKSSSEIKTLADTFNRMAQSIEESRNAIRDKERLDKELEIARNIQRTLLPASIPDVDGYQIDAYYNSADRVGGDYYDIIPLDEDRKMIVVGDVAGKGVPGLVVMAMARIMVRDLAERGERPIDLLRHLNYLLKKDMQGNLFLTMFCGILDEKENTITFASAAHMPLIHRSSSGQLSMIGTNAKPLGFFEDDLFRQGLEEYRITINPGDLLLQYTDGLNEMFNEEGEEFGMERVEELFKTQKFTGAHECLVKLREILDEFRKTAPQSDDLTLLAISRDQEEARSDRGQALSGQGSLKG